MGFLSNLLSTPPSKVLGSYSLDIVYRADGRDEHWANVRECLAEHTLRKFVNSKEPTKQFVGTYVYACYGAIERSVFSADAAMIRRNVVCLTLADVQRIYSTFYLAQGALNRGTLEPDVWIWAMLLPKILYGQPQAYCDEKKRRRKDRHVGIG